MVATYGVKMAEKVSRAGLEVLARARGLGKSLEAQSCDADETQSVLNPKSETPILRHIPMLSL